jgi:hypothetical protein
MPKTILGKWSIALFGSFIILLATGMILAASGQNGGETIFDNLALGIPMLGAGATASAAFIVGLIAIIKLRERSVLVYISTLIGFLVLIFTLGELFGPEH